MVHYSSPAGARRRWAGVQAVSPCGAGWAERCGAMAATRQGSRNPPTPPPSHAACHTGVVCAPGRGGGRAVGKGGCGHPRGVRSGAPHGAAATAAGEAPPRWGSGAPAAAARRGPPPSAGDAKETRTIVVPQPAGQTASPPTVGGGRPRAARGRRAATPGNRAEAAALGFPRWLLRQQRRGSRGYPGRPATAAAAPPLPLRAGPSLVLPGCRCREAAPSVGGGPPVWPAPPAGMSGGTRRGRRHVAAAAAGGAVETAWR